MSKTGKTVKRSGETTRMKRKVKVILTAAIFTFCTAIGGCKAVESKLEPVYEALLQEDSVQEESFTDGLLEYPQYTRPEVFLGKRVPEVLLSGHHENIRKWRRLKSLEITKKRRPDLYKSVVLTKEDKKLLNNKK